MGASQTPSLTRDKSHLDQSSCAMRLLMALQGFEPRLPLAVAYSAGADSTALLWACQQKWPTQVRAVHVHHGLQAAADGFESHAKAFCDRLGVPLVVIKTHAKHAKGQSPEQAARFARYEALHEAVESHWNQEVQSILLAQHADDQIETVLLALSRGSGLPGLSGMRSFWRQRGIDYHRPLLSLSSEDLRSALRELGLTWVEDPTNQDETFTRNKIRKWILPALLKCFPQFRVTLSRSAQHIAQAQDLLLELAQVDLLSVGNPPQIKVLQSLSDARMLNVLRHWLTLEGCASNSAQLNELLHQVRACRTRGHQIHLKIGLRMMQRHGECLGWVQ